MASEEDDFVLIKEKLEAKMVLQYPKFSVLRIMILLSYRGGLKPDQYDNLRHLFLLNYGYQEILTLIRLEQANLLTNQYIHVQKNILTTN